MINLELIAYIEHQESAGLSETEILKILMDQGGWEKSDIREAFSIANLPKGSAQATQFRAARLRSELKAKSRQPIFKKIMAFLITVGIIGIGITYFMNTIAIRPIIFAERFKTCQTGSMSMEKNGYITIFSIISRKDSVCLVNEEISGPSLIRPQKLICQFTGHDWKSAQNESSKACKPEELLETI